MALWQYNFFVLPKFPVTSEQLLKGEDNTFDDSAIWREYVTPCDSFTSIAHILPQSPSWHKDLIIYGDTSSNVFEVLCENDAVVSASFRIDFTTDYNSILYFLIEYCILNGFLLLDEDLNIIHLNVESVKGVIQASTQAQKYLMLSS